MDESSRVMTVYYIDGSVETFGWDAALNNSETSTWYSDFMKTLEHEFLIFELPDRLAIIPKQNVKSIEVNVLPPKLPPYAIKGAYKIEG